MTHFEGILPPLSRALENKGYSDLTPVQKDVANPELVASDLLVSAQTGSGKTVAFGIAIAPTLLGESEKFGWAEAPVALIVAPTRELALQVRREFEWLYGETGARIASCVGGMDMRTERRALENGAHIVVGTPGRLRDHIERGSLGMDNMRAIVLDEADEMLDLGFREDLEFILGAAPEERRTLMFSATVPRQIADLARNFQKDAIRVATVSEQKQHGDIDYQALVCAGPDRENAIINLLRYHEPETSIVFCATRATVNHMTARFTNRGFRVVALSGELSQSERTHALQAMRDGRAQICIATDVAARGIDLPGLELVVHADLPQNQEALLHRSGRTGRAGRKGISALIVPKNQRGKAERLLKWAKVTANWGMPPNADDVRAKDNERLIESFAVASSDGEEDVIAKLLEGRTPEEIAAAYIAQYRSQRSAPEELRDVGAVEEKRRSDFENSIWLSLSVGRTQKAEPRWLIPLMCRSGDITKKEIGAIRMLPEETYVELNATAADGFFAAIGGAQELEDGITVTRLEKAPDLGAPNRGGKPNGKFGKKPSHRGKGQGERKPRGGANRDFAEKPAPREFKKPHGDVNSFKKRDDKPSKKGGAKFAKPAGKSDGAKFDKPRKPRHDEAPSSDFKPKFGGAADSMPKRTKVGKPASKSAKSKPPKGFDARDPSKKLRHKASGKGKFAKGKKPTK